MKVIRTSIADVCEPVDQLHPAKLGTKEFTYIDIASLDKESKSIVSPTVIPVNEAPSRARKFVKTNDILVSTVRPNLNSVAIVEKKFNGTIASTGFAILRPKSGVVSPRFLYYLVRTSAFISEMVGHAKGANYPAVSDQIVKSFVFNLPHLSIQRRAAEILDEADALLRWRRHADKHHKKLLPVLFRRFFGSISENRYGYRVESIRKLCTKYSDGPFGSNLKSSHYSSTGVRVVRLQNIGRWEFIDRDKAYIPDSHFSSLQKHECLPGDVLIGTMGDPNLRACIQPDSVELSLNKADCIQARPDTKMITSEYLCGILNDPSFLAAHPSLVAGQTRARVSMGRLADIRIPVPPMELQSTFSELAVATLRLKRPATTSAAALETLFQSLLARAFDGRLVSERPADSRKLQAEMNELLQEIEFQAKP